VIHDFSSSIDIFRHLRACILATAQNTFLLVWFERKLERVLDRIWRISPSKAYVLHEQVLRTMESRIQNFLPEIIDHGCAPVPNPEPETNDALKKIGLRLHATGQLNLVYATITFWPWKGGCSCCALRENCLKNPCSQH